MKPSFHRLTHEYVASYTTACHIRRPEHMLRADQVDTRVAAARLARHTLGTTDGRRRDRAEAEEGRA